MKFLIYIERSEVHLRKFLIYIERSGAHLRFWLSASVSVFSDTRPFPWHVLSQLLLKS